VYYDFINRDASNDHFGDCEIMNCVCAAMAGLVGVSSIDDTTDDAKN